MIIILFSSSQHIKQVNIYKKKNLVHITETANENEVTQEQSK